MATPRRLAAVGLGFGLAAVAVFGAGYATAKDAGLMGLGVMVLGLAGAALLGIVGAIVSILALRREPAGADKGLAIAGLLASLAPLALMVVVAMVVQLERGEQPAQPLEPPPPELRPEGADDDPAAP